MTAVHAKLSAPAEVMEAAIAKVEEFGATVRLDWVGVREAHNAKPGLLYPASLVERQAREIAELKGLAERLKQEAQIHTQEARTANSTIAEIYRRVSGGTGEPGNWNGAKPVRELLDDQRARLSRQGEVIKRAAEAVGQLCNVISADCCDEHGIWSEYEAAVAALDAIRSVEGV